MASLVAAHVAVRDDALARAGTTWREVVSIVHRQMRSIVGPTRELEDLTQVALEAVVSSIDRFEGRAALSSFTYRVCANVAMNHWRSWSRWLRRFTLGLDEAPVEVTAAPDLVDAERTRRLHAALDRLSANKRIVLTLCELEELPASAVAEIVGCPEATVRSRLRQARIDLSALLRDDPLFAEEEP